MGDFQARKYLDGVTKGTATASKAVILDENSKIDTLDITAPKINGTTLIASRAASVTAATAASVTAAAASDTATTIALANDCKAKVNLTVTLANDNKAKINAIISKLVAQGLWT